MNVKNPFNFIKQDGHSYPTNTKVSGTFNGEYISSNDTHYHHEGIDFSGNSKNFIKNWKLGIEGNIIRQYYNTGKTKFLAYERMQTGW